MSAAGIGWSSFAWKGSEVRISKQEPENITADTLFVTLEGQIKKPENDSAKCVIAFEAAYRRDHGG